MDKWFPKHLTQAQIDQIYAQQLAELEAIHLRATITARRNIEHGENLWDTEKGEAFIESVRQQWHAGRAGPAED